MDRLFFYLVVYAPWIIGLCAVLFVWALLRLLFSGRDRAYYNFEFDRLNRKRDNALWWMIISIVIGTFIIYLSRTTARTMSEETMLRLTPTATLTFFGTPLPDGQLNRTAGREANGARPTLIPYPTSTPIIAPTSTLQDPASAGSLVRQVAQPTRRVLRVEPIYDGCDGGVAIDQPASGTTLSEGVTLFGRAMANDFNYYTIEINGPETNNRWINLLDGIANAPVQNGFLGSGRFPDWEEGIYQIELTTYNQARDIAGFCRIQIGILND